MEVSELAVTKFGNFDGLTRQVVDKLKESNEVLRLVSLLKCL